MAAGAQSRRDVRVRQSASYKPTGWSHVTPRIIVRNPKALVGFLRKVFGAKGRYSADGPTELRIGDSIVMISEAGIRRVYNALLYVYVPDTDAVYRRAVKAGARSIEAPGDMPYGDRRCMFDDRFGNTWQVATRLPRRRRA